MKKVLHITNWYPNEWNNLESTFIKEQYQLFSEVRESHLLHIQVREDKNIFSYKHIIYSDKEEGYYLLTRIRSSKIIELLTTFLLLWVLCKRKYKQYKIWHFHIAYPLLSYYYLWKKILKIPIIISEHWSAYHFHFYMSKETKKLEGIKRIFKQNIPLLVVSKSLLNDIKTFVGVENISARVVPNVIDLKYFYYHKRIKNQYITFFSVNQWRAIKNPFPMLEGFRLLYQKNKRFKLVLGGYGELLDEMKAFVLRYNMSENIIFVGKMNKKEVADKMSKSDAYIISSKYETFSVVCAEALLSGTPIIGTYLSAVAEYAPKNAYLSFEDNLPERWLEFLEYFITNQEKYNHKEIASMLSKTFDNSLIQKLYEDILLHEFS